MSYTWVREVCAELSVPTGIVMRRYSKLPLRPSCNDTIVAMAAIVAPAAGGRDVVRNSSVEFEMKLSECKGENYVWEDLEVIECLGERCDLIYVTKQTRIIDGRRQQRWLSSRGNEILVERSDGHFDTENCGEIIVRIPVTPWR